MDKNVICIKWGTKFGPDYVNRLYKMVEKNLKIPHRFVCFTDNAEGLVEGIEVRDLPEYNDNTVWQPGMLRYTVRLFLHNLKFRICEFSFFQNVRHN